MASEVQVLERLFRESEERRRQLSERHRADCERRLRESNQWLERQLAAIEEERRQSDRDSFNRQQQLREEEEKRMAEYEAERGEQTAQFQANIARWQAYVEGLNESNVSNVRNERNERNEILRDIAQSLRIIAQAAQRTAQTATASAESPSASDSAAVIPAEIVDALQSLSVDGARD